MRKILKEFVKEGIVQVTIADERWYIKDTPQGSVFVPSVTWIADSYPKGKSFYKWLADKGWDEAEEIKVAAGDKGSKVHAAIVDLIDGKGVRMDAKYLNPSTGVEEELTLEEYEALVSFVRFWKLKNPKTIARETVVFNEEYGYAGTVDWVGVLDGKLTILDFKTSSQVWPAYEMQVSAYKHAMKSIPVIEIHGGKKIKVAKPIETLAILQVGYRRNRDGWKLTPIEDKFDLFLAARKIWENEHKDEQPTKRDYPESIKLKDDAEDKGSAGA